MLALYAILPADEAYSTALKTCTELLLANQIVTKNISVHTCLCCQPTKQSRNED